MDEDPIDADMPDITQEHQQDDVPADANTGWGTWQPQRWLPTDYQPDHQAPPSTDAGSSSSAPEYLTQLF